MTMKMRESEGKKSAKLQVVGVGDLVYLDPLTEENIIENLNARFKHDQIYVSTTFFLYS